MSAHRVSTFAVLALAFASPGAAQQAPSVPPPPVRQLGPITGVSHDSLSSVAAAVHVAGGRVLVNDILARRVLLYDSTLSSMTVVADSANGGANSYGTRPGTLLAFHGDSALFITPAALSMLVLSPTGQITRTMAMPPSGNGLPALIGNIFGTPGFDARGRLAYFSPVRMQFRGPPPQGGAGPTAMEPPDSAFVVRFDFASRALDTAGVIKIQRARTSINRSDDGKMNITMTAMPPLAVDDWAVTSDGAIAMVRGRDYHVDRLNPDGSWSSQPRIPYEWEHLDDSAKTALLDSMTTAMQANMDSMQARLQRNGPQTGPAGNTVAAGGAERAGAERGLVMTFVGPAGGGERGRDGAGGAGPPSVSFPTPHVVRASLSEVPDYLPPFRQGAVRADVEGNLWIRTNKMADGRPVYDVVNRDGKLVDRVQLPAFRTIAGFGPGVVYMGVRDSTGVMHVEKARVR
jgi:hypothetical protein